MRTLGLGNPLLGDDAVGLEVAALVRERLTYRRRSIRHRRGGAGQRRDGDGTGYASPAGAVNE